LADWRTSRDGQLSEFERAMIRERTSAGLAEARAAGRIGGSRAKLTVAQRADVVENVLAGRRTAAEMARLYQGSEATISRIVSVGRQVEAGHSPTPSRNCTLTGD
jgi:DNA invertase Pin-like site-specific DNA recombinase